MTRIFTENYVKIGTTRPQWALARILIFREGIGFDADLQFLRTEFPLCEAWNCGVYAYLELTSLS